MGQRQHCASGFHFLICIFFSVFLSACGGGSSSDSGASESASRSAQSQTEDTPPEPSPYVLANACYALQVRDEFVAIDPVSGGYTLDPEPDNAEPFYFKPSGLERFLLMDSGAELLADHDSPTRTAMRDMRLEWLFVASGFNTYRLQATETSRWLLAQGSALVSDNDGEIAAEFKVVPAQGCEQYPETTTNSIGEPSIGEFEDGAVWGIADVHAHLFGTLAYGGNVMVGDVFHPLGIEKALEDCSNQHGRGGRTDLTGFATGNDAGSGHEFESLAKLPFKLLFGQALHDTSGYPDFREWPSNRTTTHQLAYYKWLERAYKGGLRLMVHQVIESGPLCKVGKALAKSYAPSDPNYEYDPDVSCNGNDTADRQIEATHALVDYIDAQHGGPGKGWMRIVNTPEEARRVIKEKKLAVLMGSEIPDLFSCIDGVDGGRADCTQDYVIEKLDEYVAKGVRSIFPVHHYDNDFGGAYVFNPIVEAGKVVQDGALFHYEACDAFDYKPLLAIQVPSIYYMLFPKFLKDAPLFPLIPEADGYCNTKGLTDIGAFLVREMMRRGLLIETAHLSYKTKQAVIEMAEYYDYPLLDTHMAKAFETSAVQEEARYLKLGGVRAPLPNRKISAIENYQSVYKTCESHTSQDLAMQLMAFSDARKDLGLERGVVFGTDVHGMVQTTKPRFGDRAQCDAGQTNPVSYPFTSFDGSVVFERQKTGNREFDFNTEGMAHLGLLPDLIQDMRNQGMSDEYLEAFFRGAESYLQAWEKARDSAGKIHEM